MGKTGALKYGTGYIKTEHGGTQHCLSSTFLRARFERSALLCVRGSSSRAMTTHGARPARPRRVSAGSSGTGPNPPSPHPVTAEPRPALRRGGSPEGRQGHPQGTAQPRRRAEPHAAPLPAGGASGGAAAAASPHAGEGAGGAGREGGGG